MTEAPRRHVPPRDLAVADAVRQAISRTGTITFAEYMEIALYGPGGYYERHPVGEEGDFLTSPHVHPLFGELLAAGLRSMWEWLDRPEPLHLVELGAGDGTLAEQLCRALADVRKDYVAVERSPGARERLALRRIRSVPSIEVLDQHLDGCVFANELLDNLPFARLRADRGGRLLQLGLEMEGEALRVAEWPVDDPDLLELVPPLAPGEEGVVPIGAVMMLDRVARILRRGYALFIDYAAPAPGVPAVHGYRRHRVIADVLAAEPGTVDITAGVDFEALRRRAASLGLKALGPVTQRSALLALGFADWAERERRRQQRALDERAGRDAVLAWSGRNAAHSLIDPAGLGGFRWLALATVDVDWPEWLARAEWLDVGGGEA